MNMETAAKTFSQWMQHWTDHGFGPWTVREKEIPEFIIGFGGLDYRLYGNDMRLNVGYRFDKKYWGKGYATELAKRAIVFGFTDLNVPEIYAIVRPKHLVSIKVLEKCQMIFAGELQDVANEANSLMYLIRKNN